eukprot:INCI5018.1.p1 GENE.INCI5018.1~~INCI5018.1.p1  ORF type:complete len:242 (-),score=53.82 INCI5018.1:101-826(-)
MAHSERVRAAAEASAKGSPRRRTVGVSPLRSKQRVREKQNKLAARWAAATSEHLTGQTLWTAASQGDVAKVRECLAAGVDVDWRDKYDGTTAAWLAAKDNNAEILAMLAAAGADLFHVTSGNNRWSCAEVAAYYGSVGALKVLYNNGVDVFQDLTGDNGQSPHEILWYRFNLSLEEVLEEDDAALATMGVKLFQAAMELPASSGLHGGDGDDAEDYTAANAEDTDDYGVDDSDKVVEGVEY